MDKPPVEQAISEFYEQERARLNALGQCARNQGIYQSPVFGEGSIHPKLLIIGEAPGAREVELQKPFVGKAGSKLDELLCLANIRRADIYISNAVKFRPVRVSQKSVSNRTPSIKEVEESLPLLWNELMLLQPQWIATLGNIPLMAVLKLCGKKRRMIGDAHGKAIDLALGQYHFSLFPLYHPASVIYNSGLQEVCARDAKALGGLICTGCEQIAK